MKTINIGACGVVLLAIGLGGCQSRAAAAADPGMGSATPIANTKVAASSVLLVANLGEADEACSCGDIIRAVRASAAKGVKAREIDTRNKEEKAKVGQQYRLVVVPAVLFLDDGGKEVTRYEGESSDTLKSVQAGLDQLLKR